MRPKPGPKGKRKASAFSPEPTEAQPAGLDETEPPLSPGSASKAAKRARRAEQNRLAQKVFRDRQNAQFREMKEKMAVFEEMESKVAELEGGILQANSLALSTLEEVSRLEAQVQTLKAEREGMIHIMDRLRADNTFLQEERDKQRRLAHFASGSHSGRQR
ncbi:hypothetical protein HDU91_000250, partial [Kappamyces sp. JEL0680]